MEKKTLTTIKSQDDFLKMVDSLPANSNKSRTKVKATVTDIPSLDVSKLQGLAERIYLAGVNIELNLLGDVGIYSTALLSRRFKRTGFAGRNINLAIPTSLNQQEKDLLINRICSCAKSESSESLNTLIQKGASISMVEAKELGLVDQVIDLSKRRGTPKTAVAVSNDKPVV